MRERIYMKLHSVVAYIFFSHSISTIVQDGKTSSLLGEILLSTSSKMFTQMGFAKKSRSLGKNYKENVSIKNASWFGTIVSEIMS